MYSNHFTAIKGDKYAYMLVLDSYINATQEERDAICNGCGAASSKFDFVPDTIYGLCINPACNPHDWEYHHGKVLADKIRADSLFYTNILRLIKSYGGPLQWLRERRALKYYLAVKHLGESAFFEGKDGN